MKVGLALVGASMGFAGAMYGALAAATWCRYGRQKDVGGERSDLDIFLPNYEVVEKLRVTVRAPAHVTFSSASTMTLEDSLVVRCLFRAREMFFGSERRVSDIKPGLVEQAKLWGWGVLKESPGREIIFGAVTQPWTARPIFAALDPSEFACFDRLGYAKIIWSLRSEAIGKGLSTLSTETRVSTTDETSRARFRRYWALVLPGVVMIRLAALHQVKRIAEARVRRAGLQRELKEVKEV